MEYVQEITLELNSNTAYTTIGAKQGDSNTRKIKVHITRDGQDYNLRENNVDTAYFRFRKPDGKAIINSATVVKEENYIALTLTAQTLSAAGRGYADIVLQNGSDVLSTVSFIIIVMSAPQVAEQAVSSDEFGQLNAVVENATHTIYEAEAWAAGTRGGVEIYGEDSLVLDTNQIGVNWTPNETEGKATFKAYVKSKPGVQRIYTFTCLNEPEDPSNRQWNVMVQTNDGMTTTNENLGIILNNNLISYGLEVEALAAINSTEYFTVTIKEKDLAYENNAKYYSEQAALNVEYIEKLSVSAETLPAEESATVAISSVGDHRNIHFGLPRGDTGDVYFMNFDIDAATGSLIMYKPSHTNPELDFYIGEDNGNLYMEIIN